MKNTRLFATIATVAGMLAGAEAAAVDRHNASTLLYDKEGNLLGAARCSTKHPLGPQARDPLGRPYAGEHKGQWEPNSPDAPHVAGSITARIIAAMEAVDRSKADNLTASGKPKVEALEAALGAQISYQQRDLVWHYLNAAAAGETIGTAAAVSSDVQAASIDSRQSLIEGAIRKLDRSNSALWMPKGGKPRLEVIESLIGGVVSAAERDAAWHIVSQE